MVIPRSVIDPVWLAAHPKQNNSKYLRTEEEGDEVDGQWADDEGLGSGNESSDDEDEAGAGEGFTGY